MQTKKLLALTATGTVALCAALALGFSSTHRTAMETDAQSPPNDILPPTCIFGWSKDNCAGSLLGDVEFHECRRIVQGQHVLCRTAHLRDAEFVIPLRQNSGTCGGSNLRCDETPKLDGKILLKGDFAFDREGCALRGAWEGEWRLVDNNGNTVAFGIGMGTLGTGSHRPPVCITSIPTFPITCNPACEKCYDVDRTVTEEGVFWHVGIEGMLRGEVFAGEWAGSLVNVTLSGTLNTPNPSQGEPDFREWHYCGATDGVVLARCDN